MYVVSGFFIVKEDVSTVGLPVFLINVSGPKAAKVDAWEIEEIRGIMQRLIVNRLVLTTFLLIPIHISLYSAPAFSSLATVNTMNAWMLFFKKLNCCL